MLKFTFEENERNDLLVDTSYLVHCLCFRALGRWKEYHSLPDSAQELYEIDFSRDEEFVHIFSGDFKRTVFDVRRRFGVSKNRVVFCMDCPKKDIWRRSIYPEYKAHRMVKQTEGLNRGPLFKHVSNCLIPEICEETGAVSVGCPVAEADDVIAVITMGLKKLSPDTDVVILSSDQDMWQLMSDHVLVINSHMEVLNERSSGPKLDLMTKVLLGDGGDNIPPCFSKTKGDKVLGRGFGHKAAVKLATDQSLLKEYLIRFPEAVSQIKVNRQIIDFNFIPHEVKGHILREWMTKRRSP